VVELVPLAEVKRLLDEEAGRRALPREATLAKQQAELFARLDLASTEKLMAELKALEFVDTAAAIRVADTLPQYPEEVRLLFSRDRIVLDEAQITQILETVAHYR
jgi:DNA-directed RNA polymerase subunit F